MNNQQFSYDDHKGDRVTIFHQGRPVTTLKGRAAIKFINLVEGATVEAQQLAMARATGNFKRGNER